MGMSKVFDDMMEEKLLNMHTAFIGTIVKMEGADKCSVKPLDKIKSYGQKAKEQAVVSRVPILNHVRRYTLVKQNLTVQDTYTGGGTITPNPHPTPSNEGHLRVEPLKAGDIVLCVCAERDISSSSKGKTTTPPVGHHQIANALVVGYLGRWPHE